MLMSKSEYATHRGISRAAISKHLRNGTIVADDNNKIDSEIADWLLDQYSTRCTQVEANPTLGETERSLDDDSYLAQRALLTKYKAQLTKIELDQKEGRLVESSTLHDDSFAAYRKLRDALYSMSDRLSGAFAAESDPHKIHRLLTKEHTDLLSTLKEELHNLFRVSH